jgi:hypothetical protein
VPNFQIRREPFGIAVQDGETASEALLDHIAAVVRGRLALFVQTFDDGTAEVEYEGEIYRAVPPGWKQVPPRFERGRPPTGYTIEIPFE